MKTYTLITTILLLTNIGLLAQSSSKDNSITTVKAEAAKKAVRSGDLAVTREPGNIDSSTTGTKADLTDKVVNIKLLLEGLYAGFGTMVPVMDEIGYHWGEYIADKLTVELHNELIFAEIDYTANDVSLNIDGTATFTIPASYNGNYYIAIKHRNHVLTASAIPISFEGATIYYDFESAATQAFGENMLLSDYFYLFYSGDSNQDGIVDATDLSDIGNQAANASAGYISEDFNGDGLVDGSDLSIACNNASFAIMSMVPLSIPIVSTTIVTNITSNSATSGGHVSLDGGAPVVARGVCWSTNPNPTTANTKTNDGVDTGTFVSNLTVLMANTLYYVRAYATNSEGTAYGNDTTFTTPPLWFCGTPMTDSRDGKTYNTVLIGTHCWFAQNLNIGTKVLGNANQTNNSIIEKYCYNDLESNCDVYGGLYQWDEAMQYSTTEGVQGICPTGWHLPTDPEWSNLTTFLGGPAVAGGKMKEAGTAHWLSPNTGATNSSGFTALPGGYRYIFGNFINLANSTTFWSSSQASAPNAWYRDLNYSYENVGLGTSTKPRGFSGRCVKN